MGITQIQAAKACGVSRRTYQTYEEAESFNASYDELIRKFDEMGIFDGSNYISNPRRIRFACHDLFSEKYPEIQCIYLFGSYARGEANGATLSSDKIPIFMAYYVKSSYHKFDFIYPPRSSLCP